MDTIDNIVSQVSKIVTKLEQERDDWKTKAENGWKYQYENSKLQQEVNELRSALEKTRKENAQLREDGYYWRTAVRMEQCLKRREKNGKKIRHLPTFNFIKRASFSLPGEVNRERIFITHWRRENARGLIRSLLSDNPNDHGADITQRDATVAATVIQWLGTNIGQCFLGQVAQQIEKLKQRRARQTSRASSVQA